MYLECGQGGASLGCPALPILASSPPPPPATLSWSPLVRHTSLQPSAQTVLCRDQTLDRLYPLLLAVYGAQSAPGCHVTSVTSVGGDQCCRLQTALQIHCSTAAPPLHHHLHHAKHECQEEAAQTGILFKTTNTAPFLFIHIILLYINNQKMKVFFLINSAMVL